MLSKNHGKRSMPRDWKKYDEFRRLDEMIVLNIILKAVNALDPAYKVREKGSGGRPDADSRVKLLIFRAFLSTSYRSIFSKLHDNVEYSSVLNTYLHPVLCRPTIKTFLRPTFRGSLGSLR